jgi:hypothetical protein
MKTNQVVIEKEFKVRMKITDLDILKGDPSPLSEVSEERPIRKISGQINLVE